ncbi:hypothetical protein NGF75_08365 [Dietzia kunjamensis]|uniref:hypothetical protein n=1 Tax=Dietzia kunjamensis TaxID=322509 RepID=UPI002DBA7CFC|nr:hypothetical protein [Dietzia kunjamensis]MEB8326000.1 hypothetical protein [Dietzia kunjamensis]
MLSMLVLVAGCGGKATNAEPTGADTTSSSSSARPTTSKATTTTTVERKPETDTAATEAPAAANPAAAGPTLVQCIYGGGAWTGSGWLSDGSAALHPQCEALRSEQLAEYPYQCPQTDQQVADLADCANSSDVTVAPETQNPSVGEALGVTAEPVEPPVEPTSEPESGEAPEVDPCEAGDTSEACLE